MYGPRANVESGKVVNLLNVKFMARTVYFPFVFILFEDSLSFGVEQSET
jgi:hypothetical protein